MPDSLATRVRAAVAELVAGIAAEVPADQVYHRPAGEFSPSRDLAAGTGGAVVVFETPGAGVTARELLRVRDLTYPVTVLLVTPQNRTLKTGDPERPTGPDWREVWAEAVVALTGRQTRTPLPSVTECRRLSLESGVALDLTQYEASNLWVKAVSIRCICRVNKG